MFYTANAPIIILPLENLPTNAEVPEWSKGSDSSSDRRKSAGVQIPVSAILLLGNYCFFGQFRLHSQGHYDI